VKPVVIQRLAEQDIFGAIDHYAQHAGHVVDRFLSAVDVAMDAIGRSPRIGSPAFAEALDIAGLRFRTLRSFPYAVFYQEFDADVRVLRVLHHGRDVMSLIGAADGD
jgi:plasmid stabilization system protein ParE